MLLFLRTVLEDAHGFDHALEMIRTTELATSALITLVGRANDQRVVIERTPTRTANWTPQGDRPLVATNDFRTQVACGFEGAGELAMTACVRFGRLSSLASGQPPTVCPETSSLLAMLCHPDVQMEITCQHVIARPAADSLRLFVPARLRPGG